MGQNKANFGAIGALVEPKVLVGWPGVRGPGGQDWLALPKRTEWSREKSPENEERTNHLL